MSKVRRAINTTMFGIPVTLVGRQIKDGSKAPNFHVVDGDLKEVTLDKFEKKIKIITSFLSLDTPVCDLQVNEFNKRAGNLTSKVVILAISKDLPFAQKRFCHTNSINHVFVLSDYRTSSFGINYGLLIKENNLLARATVIVDADNNIRLFDVVNEMATPPNYDHIFSQLNQIISSASPQITDPVFECPPCKCSCIEYPLLAKDQIKNLFALMEGWQLIEEKSLIKELQFNDFSSAKYFLDLLAIVADEQQHHPSFTLQYNKLTIALQTHRVNGLTESDFRMAKIIDELIVPENVKRKRGDTFRTSNLTVC